MRRSPGGRPPTAGTDQNWPGKDPAARSASVGPDGLPSASSTIPSSCSSASRHSAAPSGAHTSTAGPASAAATAASSGSGASVSSWVSGTAKDGGTISGTGRDSGDQTGSRTSAVLDQPSITEESSGGQSDRT